MNNKCLILAAAFAVTLIACGDDSSTSASDSKSQTSEVKNFGDLPRCTSNKEGDTVFVSKDDASYVCENREWVLVEDDEEPTSSSTKGSSSSFDKSKFEQVDTKEDLEKCTSKIDGDSVYVKKEDALFTCEKLKWVEVVFETEKPKYEEFKTLDSLPTCGTKTKGDTIFVTKEKELYTCENKKWVKVEESENDGDSSSSKGKDSDDDSPSKNNDDDDSPSKNDDNNDSPSKNNDDDDDSKPSSSDDKEKPGDDEKPEEKVPAAKECTADSVNKVTKLDTNYFVCTDAKWNKIAKDKVLELDLKLGFICGKDTKVIEGKLCEKESGKCEAAEFTNYTCDKNSEEKYEWRRLTEEELEAIEYAKLVEELGECNAENANKVVKANDEKIYACINDEWKEQSGTELRELELQLGKLCSNATKNDTVHFESDVYECRILGKAGKDWYEWIKMTEIEIDTYGLKCKEENSGNVMEGGSGTEYVCNYNTTYFPFMTVDSLKKIVKNSSCMGKDFETIKYKGASWSCVEKKWKFDANTATVTLNIGTTEYNTVSYNTVWIGFQNWMAENLGKDIIGSATDNTNGIYCYNDDGDKCSTYGALYTRDAAQTACPTGWHLPDATEWEELKSFIQNDQGLSNNAVGLYLKSKTGWENDGNGNDVYGFNGLPAGHRFTDGLYNNIGNRSYFWSSTDFRSSSAYFYYFYDSGKDLSRDYENKTSAKSVRCVKDSN